MKLALVFIMMVLASSFVFAVGGQDAVGIYDTAKTYTAADGKEFQLENMEEKDLVRIRAGGVEANSSLEITRITSQEKTNLQAGLSNGKTSEIKIMPDTASEIAMERLGLKVCSAENNCVIQIKEVGSGEQARAVYEVKADKKAKLFWILNTKMNVRAQVDAQSGNVTQIKKPWWAFLASETEQ